METRVFEHWGDFYLLVGTAAAALLALLFVAVSLGVGFLTEQRAAPTRAFFSPIVVHFAAVLFLSAVALVPSRQPLFFVVLIGAAGLVGLIISVVTTVQLLRNQWTQYLVDHLGYGLLPAVAYLALIASAALLHAGQAIALEAFAGALVLLLMVNIRNAWDLMLSMVRQHAQSTAPEEINRSPSPSPSSPPSPP